VLSIRKLISTSLLLMLLKRVDWTSILVSGGMMNVAMVVLRSTDSSSLGRRSFHTGSILILSVLSSYLRRPCSERNFENSASLLVSTPSCCDISSMLCHDPFLIMVKNLSMAKVIGY